MKKTKRNHSLFLVLDERKKKVSLSLSPFPFSTRFPSLFLLIEMADADAATAALIARMLAEEQGSGYFHDAVGSSGGDSSADSDYGSGGGGRAKKKKKQMAKKKAANPPPAKKQRESKAGRLCVGGVRER